jgi:Ser/Thr protein kinase RdoA (MazF antagonist)
MTEAEIIARAIAAQEHWNGRGDPVLIGQRENAVFRITTKDGDRLALRLHRNGYQTRDHIDGEMIWTEALAKANFPCPRPVRTKDGALIISFEDGQMATAVSWINAGHIGGLDAGRDANEQLYAELGKLLSQLHTLTDTLSPTISRPSWEAQALLGPSPTWGRFWENPSLTAPEKAIVCAARDAAAKDLNQLENPNIGLIHADAIVENVLLDQSLHLIDFDDSGYGYRLYDLGVALVPHENSAHLPALTKAICDGYGTDTKHMPLFIMLRAMASAGWIISRAEPNSPTHRKYADRMLRCIKAYNPQ